jgi:hypothetical protein
MGKFANPLYPYPVWNPSSYNSTPNWYPYPADTYEIQYNRPTLVGTYWLQKDTSLGGLLVKYGWWRPVPYLKRMISQATTQRLTTTLATKKNVDIYHLNTKSFETRRKECNWRVMNWKFSFNYYIMVGEEQKVI